MIRIPEPQARFIANELYIAAFNARSPSEIALDLIEMKDTPWTAADRARRAELLAEVGRG